MSVKWSRRWIGVGKPKSFNYLEGVRRLEKSDSTSLAVASDVESNHRSKFAEIIHIKNRV